MEHTDKIPNAKPVILIVQLAQQQILIALVANHHIIFTYQICHACRLALMAVILRVQHAKVVGIRVSIVHQIQPAYPV